MVVSLKHFIIYIWCTECFIWSVVILVALKWGSKEFNFHTIGKLCGVAIRSGCDWNCYIKLIWICTIESRQTLVQLAYKIIVGAFNLSFELCLEMNICFEFPHRSTERSIEEKSRPRRCEEEGQYLDIQKPKRLTEAELTS